MDDSRHADEGAARAPGAAVPPRHRDSQRGAEARGRQFAGGSPVGVASRSTKSGCAGCSGTARSRPCRTASARAFGTGAAEETDHPREVIEAALAHVVQNRVEAAYRRTDLFERRPARLMNDWETYLAGAPETITAGEQPNRPEDR